MMDYERHDSTLASRLELLDKAADTQLSRELMQLHKKKCITCQEDRLACTVRPACKDRNFLNMLIDLGVEVKDLPSFCYSVYLDQVKRYILEKRTREMVDRRVPIRDFLSALNMSSIRQFTTRFSKIWARFSTVREGNLLLVTGDDMFFHFDFARDTVVLNPNHIPIRDFQALRLYVSLFSEYYNLKCQLIDETTNWWILAVEVKNKEAKKQLESLKSLVAHRIELLSLKTSDGGIRLQVEIITDDHRSPPEVGDLRKVFGLAAGQTQTGNV
ncbi:MAG: hypothetical protein C4K47_10840 [Candidatus Thorarchaeota archaeon]|nr:MAG: hypothetical protein C4K47_10840 [Candidatus Thorarchaeota archaeon]